MRVRLLATDLDGTLLTSAKTVSPRTAAALDAAHAAGLHVVPISGRQPYAIRALLAEHAWLGPVVASNGSIGADVRTGEVYFEELLDADAQRALADRLAEEIPGVLFVSVREAGDGFYPQRGYPATVTSVGPHDRDPAEMTEYELADVLSTPSLKLVVRHPTRPAEELYEVIRDIDLAGAHVTISGAPFLEAAREGVTKATGLAALCVRLGVSADEVVAFGDHHNDVELLRWAGCGVAMGNALPEVQAEADEVTASNDDDGLAMVVERLLAAG